MGRKEKGRGAETMEEKGKGRERMDVLGERKEREGEQRIWRRKGRVEKEGKRKDLLGGRREKGG